MLYIHPIISAGVKQLPRLKSCQKSGSIPSLQQKLPWKAVKTEEAREGVWDKQLGCPGQAGWPDPSQSPDLQGRSSGAEPGRAQHEGIRLVRRTHVGNAMGKTRSECALGQGWLSASRKGRRHCPGQHPTLSMQAAESTSHGFGYLSFAAEGIWARIF